MKKLDEEKEAKRAANADKINPGTAEAFNEYKQNMKGRKGLKIGSYVEALPVTDLKMTSASSNPLFKHANDAIKGYHVYGIVIDFLTKPKFNNWKQGGGEECLILYKIFKYNKNDKNNNALQNKMKENFHSSTIGTGTDLDVNINPAKKFKIVADGSKKVEWWKKLDDLQIGICKTVQLYKSNDKVKKKEGFETWWTGKIKQLWIQFLSKWKSPVNTKGFVFDSDQPMAQDKMFSKKALPSPKTKWHDSVTKLHDNMVTDMEQYIMNKTYDDGTVIMITAGNKIVSKEKRKEGEVQDIKKAFNDLIEKLKQQTKDTTTTQKFAGIENELQKLQNIFPSINLLFSQFVSIFITHNIKTNYQRSSMGNEKTWIYTMEEEAIREFIINYPKIEEKDDSQLKLKFYT